MKMLQSFLFLACLAPNVVLSLYISSSLYSLNQPLVKVPTSNSYTLGRAPFGTSVQVYSGPAQKPANPVTTTTTRPPPPPRPILQPTVFFTQANVPMGIYRSYICGLFNRVVNSDASYPQLPYDPHATCRRLVPLSNWLNSQTTPQKFAPSMGLNLRNSDEDDSSDSMVISNPDQELLSNPQAPYVRVGRKRRHVYNKPRFDHDAVCYVLNNYAQTSRYCRVRTTANLVLSRLNCKRVETRTTLKSTTTTTTPTTTTTTPTKTTTEPTTTTTTPTTTTTTTPSTTTTTPTTAPTTTTTEPTTTTTTTTTTPSTTTTTLTTTPSITTATPTTTLSTTTTTTPSTTPTTTTTTTTSTTTTTPTTTTTKPTTTTTTPTTITTLKPTTDECGVSDVASLTSDASSSDLPAILKIVGGVDAGTCTTYPWMVRLKINNFEICGGTILDATHILTAAQCISAASSIQATVGEYDASVVAGTEQIFDIVVPDGVSRHPNFSFNDRTNDIAVLTLSTPIDFSRICAKPVCLDPTYHVTYGQKCQIAGWGVLSEDELEPSDILQTVSISTYTGADCSAAFPDINNGYVTDPARQLCAGELAGGVDTCSGDAGGPLFCLDEATNKWNVVGVTSYGQGCAKPGSPGVYTDTSVYYDWIQQQLTKA